MVELEKRLPVRLQPGLAHLVRRVERAVIVPLALEYPFWTERLPEALCRFGEPLRSSDSCSVASWHAKLEDGLAHTMDALAADTIARDPSRFIDGRVGRRGVGGLDETASHGAWHRFLRNSS